MPIAVTKVGFVGLGNLGGPMARLIADAGYPLQVWARRAESLAEVAGSEATIAPDLVALGRHSEIVGLCVMADTDVVEVAEQILVGMEPGGIIVIHSTVLPSTCEHVGEIASSRGVAVVDAPAIGGRNSVQQRVVALTCGGEAADYERCLPVLETFGNPVRRFGPLGSGQVVKLINNFVFTARLDILLRAVEAAELMGFSRAEVAEILTHDLSRTRSRMTPLAVGGHLAPESLPKTCSVLGKDLAHVLATYSQYAIDPEPLAALAQDALDPLAAEAQGSGFGLPD